MSVNVLYRTTATATGGRDGHAATKDGALDVTLSTPKEASADAESMESSPVSLSAGPLTRILACSEPRPSRAIDRAAAFDGSPASTRRRKWTR